MTVNAARSIRFTVFLMLLLAAVPAMARRTSPVDGGVVTSGVGWRPDPFGSGRMVYHYGYDIAVPVGTPVYPVEAGTVSFAGQYKGYGQMVVVDHGNGYVTIYGHNSEIKVQAGQRVDCSTVVALSGSTGRSTGPHVHYELRTVPGKEKERQASAQGELKQLVEQQIDGWVQESVGAKGGGGNEPYLPQGVGE